MYAYTKFLFKKSLLSWNISYRVLICHTSASSTHSHTWTCFLCVNIVYNASVHRFFVSILISFPFIIFTSLELFSYYMHYRHEQPKTKSKKVYLQRIYPKMKKSLSYASKRYQLNCVYQTHTKVLLQMLAYNKALKPTRKQFAPLSLLLFKYSKCNQAYTARNIENTSWIV